MQDLAFGSCFPCFEVKLAYDACEQKLAMFHAFLQQETETFWDSNERQSPGRTSLYPVVWISLKVFLGIQSLLLPPSPPPSSSSAAWSGADADGEEKGFDGNSFCNPRSQTTRQSGNRSQITEPFRAIKLLPHPSSASDSSSPLFPPAAVSDHRHDRWDEIWGMKFYNSFPSLFPFKLMTRVCLPVRMEVSPDLPTGEAAAAASYGRNRGGEKGIRPRFSPMCISSPGTLSHYRQSISKTHIGSRTVTQPPLLWA